MRAGNTSTVTSLEIYKDFRNPKGILMANNYWELSQILTHEDFIEGIMQPGEIAIFLQKGLIIWLINHKVIECDRIIEHANGWGESALVFKFRPTSEHKVLFKKSI